MRSKFCRLMLLLSITGCSILRPPLVDVSLVDVKFGPVNLLETTLNTKIKIDNESPSAVRFNGAVHKIYINDIYLGKGLNNETIEVPRLSSVEQEVRVDVSNISILTRLQSLIESNNFRYRVESTFYLDGSYGLGKVTANHGGQFGLEGTADIR